MKINIKQIEAFVWVADLGSFWRAGQRLRTTQPNISVRLSNLEDALGVKLMERDAGSVRLTEQGRRLLGDAREILRAAEKFVASAGQSSSVEGLIRLGITELIVNTWLPEFLTTAKQRFPKLIIELTVDLSANLKPALFSRAIDIAFQNGPFARKTSGSLDLGLYPYVWVCAPGLSVCDIEQPSTDEMGRETILAHGRDTQQFEEVVAHFSSAGKKRVDIVPSNSISPSLQMALAGIGVSALPAAMVREPIANGRLVVIDYHWVPTPLEFLARYDRQTVPAVVEDVAALASEIAAAYPKTC